MKTAKDIMTKKVVSVNPDTLLVKAVQLFIDKGFNGLPVVDKDNNLSGILTQHDLMVVGSSIHIPTFLKIVRELDLYKKDKGLIEGDLKKIFSMRVGDVMNKEPLTLSEDTSIEEVIKNFSEHHRVNPIPIVNADNKVIGIISRSDMIKLFGSQDFHATSEREIDKNIVRFLDHFKSSFILVSKTRTRLWLLVSILSVFVGFAIAWFIVLRVNF